ncbi:hypothetical protein SBY92_004112 [Candida maltosa Xu316]|uniref:Uncharacterized protein n=1 Tax=Candida maltosa (strain Xu316) TaxID=1245528 RepID=M3HMY6_CANMX|nr:hypothetical protein G210_0533 [Candida maltosa Xu316]
MKLAEALQKSSTLNKEISRLESKISSSLILQEGQLPKGNVDEKYEEYVTKKAEKTKLSASINYTNNTSPIDKTIYDNPNVNTISDLVLYRSLLSSKLSVVKDIASNGTVRNLSSKDQIKFDSCVDVGIYEDKAEALQKEIENIDLKLQEINWSADLIEI